MSETNPTFGQLVSGLVVILLVALLFFTPMTCSRKVDIDRRGENCFQTTTQSIWGSFEFRSDETVIACEEDR